MHSLSFLSRVQIDALAILSIFGIRTSINSIHVAALRRGFAITILCPTILMSPLVFYLQSFTSPFAAYSLCRSVLHHSSLAPTVYRQSTTTPFQQKRQTLISHLPAASLFVRDSPRTMLSTTPFQLDQPFLARAAIRFAAEQSSHLISFHSE